MHADEREGPVVGMDTEAGAVEEVKGGDFTCHNCGTTQSERLAFSESRWWLRCQRCGHLSSIYRSGGKIVPDQSCPPPKPLEPPNVTFKASQPGPITLPEPDPSLTKEFAFPGSFGLGESIDALRAWARRIIMMVGREVEPPTSMHGSKILPSRPWPDPPPVSQDRVIVETVAAEPAKPHDCAPCAHWTRRMREQHWGDCEALGMPTLATGGGCLRHFTPRGEGVNKWME